MTPAHSFAILVVLALGAISEASGQEVRSAPVTREQFANMSWLVGAWRGSGGNYPAFFEDYRKLNDSTIKQRALSDSTFRKATDSSEIAWRAGAVYSMKGKTISYVLVRYTKDSLHFARRDGRGGGFAWVRESPTKWKAVLAPASPQGTPTVYVMQQLRP